MQSLYSFDRIGTRGYTLRYVMAHHRRTQPWYSLSQEHVSLDPCFPIHLLSFSDPQDPIRNLHSHDVLELGVCLRGNGVFIIGNTIHPYEEGDMIAIGPGVYHRAKSGIGMQDLWDFVFFHPPDWSAPEHSRGIQRLIKRSADPHLHALMLTVTDEIRNRHSAYRKSIAGLLNSICVRISRLDTCGPAKRVPRSPATLPNADERITRAIDLLIGAGARRYRIQELAQHSCLSETHFRHLFKAQVGVCPKHFQIKLKINTAMNRLKNEQSRILDIAYECGFETLSSFNRYFKQETGVTPRQWRARKAR